MDWLSSIFCGPSPSEVDDDDRPVERVDLTTSRNNSAASLARTPAEDDDADYIAAAAKEPAPYDDPVLARARALCAHASILSAELERAVPSRSAAPAPPPPAIEASDFETKQERDLVAKAKELIGDYAPADGDAAQTPADDDDLTVDDDLLRRARALTAGSRAPSSSAPSSSSRGLKTRPSGRRDA
mmetsp:Transcript_13830/g.41491  ORF Transcript_13830/g.41491 Transcript_13830/m.41491 type:complete len:186 (+) Transcript_13830:689-1246(+)